MRLSLLLPLAAALAAPAAAQTQPATAATPAAKATYTTGETELGTLLDDPAAKAVLMKYVPDLISNEQIGMARNMTLKSLQQYAGDALTDANLAKIDGDLAKLPAK